MNIIPINSFRTRIAAILILTAIGATGVTYWFSRNNVRNIIEEVETQRSELTTALKIANRAVIDGRSVAEYLDEHKHQHAMPAQPGEKPHAIHVQRVLVVDAQGKVKDSSQRADIARHFDELGYGLFEPHSDDEKLSSNGKFQIYKFPFLDHGEGAAGRSVSYVVIVYFDDMTQELRGMSMRRIFTTGGLMIFASAISLLLILQFMHPLSLLITAATRVAAGDFDINLPVKRRDELGKLMIVFNNMVSGLRERHQLEVKLHRAEQSAIIGRLAAGIAHEVKNPLNYISLTIDYLRGKFPPANEDAREVFYEKMDNIKDEIKRLDRLIRNFLSYGRPHRFTFTPVPLPEIINNLFSRMSDQAAQQTITMRVEAEANVPAILADAEHLKSCFSNIILNAHHAMPEGGQLAVNIRAAQDGVEIAFNDTGTGIAPDHLEKIFEPYFSTKETGTGLGLALVKRIIEGHGGRISVASTPGKGTCFTVWLPTHPPQINEESLGGLATDKLISLPAY